MKPARYQLKASGISKNGSGYTLDNPFSTVARKDRIHLDKLLQCRLEGIVPDRNRQLMYAGVDIVKIGLPVLPERPGIYQTYICLYAGKDSNKRGSPSSFSEGSIELPVLQLFGFQRSPLRLWLAEADSNRDGPLVQCIYQMVIDYENGVQNKILKHEDGSKFLDDVEKISEKLASDGDSKFRRPSRKGAIRQPAKCRSD